MPDGRSIAVSPRHTVVLATELCTLVDQPPRKDFVVRTWPRREANESAADGRRAGHRGRRDPQGAPRRRNLPAALSQDLLPRPVARRSARMSSMHHMAPRAVLDPAADRPRRQRVSQLPDPGAALRARHALRRRAAREQHRQGRGADPGDGGRVVAAGRGDAGAAAAAARRRPGARRRRAAQRHRLPVAAGARPDRLRSRRPARDAEPTPPGNAVANRTWSRCCARRSTCSVLSGDSPVPWASWRGSGSTRCSAPDSFRHAIESRAEV